MKKRLLTACLTACILTLLFPIETLAQTMIPLPAHSRIYSGSVRGYWFTAPTDFIISGLRVPAAAGSGSQNIHLMRFNSPPPAYPTTTSTFTTLAYIQGAPNGVIQPTSILINAGDYIGILGTAGTGNSYATPSGPISSNIDGLPISLVRLLHQGHITSGPAPNVSIETGGPISRVEIYWDPPSTAPNDAGVASIDSPATFCAGSQNIVATIRNYGINQINPVTVNWTFNGVLQTPVTYNQVLDTNKGTGSKTAQIVLGNKTFVSGQLDDIVAWTSMPNGVVDTSIANDSASISVMPSMAGDYTIDPFGTGTTNFLTFTDAVNALNSFGICSAVKFNVAAGSYPEQVDIGNIEGTSAINTVIFQADPANTAPVEMSFTGSFADNYVVKLDGSSYVTFDNIDMMTNGGYTTAIRLEGGATNNTIKDCELTGPTAFSTSTNYAMIYLNDVTSEDNTFENNIITGGSYGIYVRGTNTTTRIPGIVIRDNTIEDVYYMGIYIWYSDGSKIIGNKISSSSSYTRGYGIYSYYGYTGQEIIGNEVLSYGTTWPRYGIYDYYARSGDTLPGIVANNMIHVGNSGSFTAHYGLTVYGAENNYVVYNSVVNEGRSTSSRVGYLYTGTNNRAYNNNFLHYGDGYSIYSLAGASYTFDHNNIASNGRNLAYNSGTVVDHAAWQARGNGTNGINVDSIYTNLDSLRTCDTALYKKGVAVSQMLYDYDGDPRQVTSPNIGADEYINNAGDFSIGDTVNFCGGDVVEIGGTMNGGTFMWSTGATTGTIEVTQAGNYSVTVDGPCVMGMTDDVEVVDVNPVANFTIGEGVLIGAFTNTSTYGTSYHWDFGDGTTSTEINPWHQYDNNGPFTVTLTVMNYCDTVTMSQNVTFSVGVNEVDMSSQFNIYPNPANNIINLATGDVEAQTVQLQIVNMKGQVATEQNVNVNKGSVNTIDISSLSKGVYMMKLTTANAVVTKQIVVQ